ncbi:FHA domain-containing protein [Clostridium estertheticum]|uniref:FHA domain-containing protein n=1 Tax=Clostridium estertheticum TaxID=238834 RepID=UPI001C0DC52F|nr:FHA domain-containing protein [Clostridium estertheticum]MBU3213625.1 FHA domain-containing protein [Clostridium estertheticum]MCB2305244.1 FHA domain-containing protein [Clostridium estertheticum]MCB2343486.1 FHA domain-containing protein [Clostridium estertheticum]MCB2348406.1 FHA domain-containing protein [Clostridium estertheticum]WAG47355.1 FHA domain-containing protein [Clostridium estertheticum]
MAEISKIMKYAIIAIIYIIIIFALRIMYKDIKGGAKKKPVIKKTMGLEVIERGDNLNLRVGAVIPLNDQLSIGRKADNLLILGDKYVSSQHAKIYIKNTDYILQDLRSTNGTIMNNKAVKDTVYIKKGDVIKIGTSTFKVIG